MSLKKTSLIQSSLYKLSLVIVFALISSANIQAGEIAPVQAALTFAQVLSETNNEESDGKLDILLVLKRDASQIEAVNLSRHFDDKSEDILDLVRNQGRTAIAALTGSSARQVYQITALQISPLIGEQHIAAGTNYLAHREEAGLGAGFLFPKYALATPFISQVLSSEGGLLDYEVELCVRFDRDLKDMEDFSAAIKGFFVCGDMTDRATLLRKVDVDDVTSGRGFTDAKSGLSRFPIGPFTVVPQDWRVFVSMLHLETRVNGELRQQSLADLMVKSIDELIEDALSQGKYNTWTFQGKSIPLLVKGYVPRGTALLAGTPEGVIYQGISTWDKVSGGFAWAVTGAFLEQSAVAYIIETVIDEGLDSGRYLQHGDEVVLSATYLGEIFLKVVSEDK